MVLKDWTLLRFVALLYILGCLIYTGIYWHELSYEEGWGVVAMIGLIGIGLFALIIDKIIRLFIKDKLWLNTLGFLVALVLTILILKG